MAKKDHTELTLDEAKEVIRTCLRTLFYRDCRASPRYQIAVVNQDGATVEEPAIIESNWEVARTIVGFE